MAAPNMTRWLGHGGNEHKSNWEQVEHHVEPLLSHCKEQPFDPFTQV